MSKLWAVVSEPKIRYRQALVVSIFFVDAKTRTEAVRIAAFRPDKDYKRPYAVEVSNGIMIRA